MSSYSRVRKARASFTRASFTCVILAGSRALFTRASFTCVIHEAENFFEHVTRATPQRSGMYELFFCTRFSALLIPSQISCRSPARYDISHENTWLLRQTTGSHHNSKPSLIRRAVLLPKSVPRAATKHSCALSCVVECMVSLVFVVMDHRTRQEAIMCQRAMA